MKSKPLAILWSVLLAALSAPLILMALTDPLPGPLQAPATPALPTMHAEARVVQVDVTVRDSKGKPVQDLKKEDFTITDNGKPRAFTIFSFNNLNDASQPKPERS